MRVQIINYNKTKIDGYITYSSIEKPHSPDEFDINIIDLNEEKIWYKEKTKSGLIDAIDDLRSIGNMILNARNATIIITLPQDVVIHNYLNTNYINGRGQKNYETKRLKDNLVWAQKNIYEVLLSDPDPFKTIYENTTNSLGRGKYQAAFYFANNYQPITLSDGSNKPTTIQYREKIYITALDITQTEEHLDNFIKTLFVPSTPEETPEWMNGIVFNDDEQQAQVISENQDRIKSAEEAISVAKQIIRKNEEIKSILYTNGDELVKVVFMILEDLFAYDFSTFVDEKKEDFLLKKENFTLIGEIKGINTNVKNENISQLEHHYQMYQDTLQEEGKTENVHQVLIINPLRKTSVLEREEIHQEQVKLAERNESLIIETKTLLKIYELFLQHKINRDDCITLFTKKTGLLKNDDVVSLSK